MNANTFDGTDRKDSYEIEQAQFNERAQHGMEGHTGYHCGQCAAESLNPILIESSSGDYWQTKQIRWQEQCDIVFRAFDDSVADHFPVHDPVNCTTCPEKPILPPKPHKPTERLHD